MGENQFVASVGHEFTSDVRKVGVRSIDECGNIDVLGGLMTADQAFAAIDYRLDRTIR